MNLGTIIPLLITLAVVGFVIAKIIIDKKQGKSSCSCGCNSCAGNGLCHCDKKAIKTKK